MGCGLSTPKPKRALLPVSPLVIFEFGKLRNHFKDRIDLSKAFELKIDPRYLPGKHEPILYNAIKEPCVPNKRFYLHQLETLVYVMQVCKMFDTERELLSPVERTTMTCNVEQCLHTISTDWGLSYTAASLRALAVAVGMYERHGVAKDVKDTHDDPGHGNCMPQDSTGGPAGDPA